MPGFRSKCEPEDNLQQMKAVETTLRRMLLKAKGVARKRLREELEYLQDRKLDTLNMKKKVLVTRRGQATIPVVIRRGNPRGIATEG